MIVSLRGTLREAAPLSAVIESAGIGYLVYIPVTTAEKLPAPGSEVFLHTAAIYREDAHTLYGFATRQERDFFLLLVEKVTGIGPRIALSILSKLSVPVLQQAIAQGDASLLAQCPGIGKKTAARLIMELKDHTGLAGILPEGSTGSASGGAMPSGTSRHSDAVTALLTLGYKAADADRAVRKACEAAGSDAGVEEIIRRALSGKG